VAKDNVSSYITLVSVNVVMGLDIVRLSFSIAVIKTLHLRKSFVCMFVFLCVLCLICLGFFGFFCLSFQLFFNFRIIISCLRHEYKLHVFMFKMEHLLKNDCE
jgi:hypothetical protein